MFCGLFGFTKQAYYRQSKHRYDKSTKQQELKSAILSIRCQMPCLGTRKLHFLLSSSGGNIIGRDRLFGLLRTDGMLIAKKKRYIITTNSKHWMRKYPNRIQKMVLFRPEQLWVSDITYISTIDENTYLHLVTDDYSKKIMDYEPCDNMESTSTCKALAMAIGNRLYKELPLIHHSDRGLQYCSKLYIETLIRNNITISMTESGRPYDNAVAERVN